MSLALRECLLLIPSSGLDDFPEGLAASDSAQVLAAWLALWHPHLISQTHAAPRWQSANQPPHNFEGLLALAPDCTDAHLPSDLLNTATNAGGWLIKPSKDWRANQLEILAALGMSEQPPVSADLQTEFAALGYAYLQIQLLTQKLRYTSNLDQLLFDSQLDMATTAALQGDIGEAQRLLQSGFDQLGQERDHYYSLEVSLLDVTLLAESTLGRTVAEQLKRDQPTTFVASAHLLRKMQQRSPEVATELQQAVRDRRVALAGGLDVERPHPLMNFDTLKRDLERGRQAYEQLGLTPPVVFTRFSFGQISDMPLHLRRSGYAGSMLIAWQDGSYPSGSHAKFSWEAAEGTFINAVAPPIVDAQSPTTYLTLGRRIAEALDHQHVPVFMMAHWPNQYSEFFELLDRVVRRTPALGKWQNIDDFFEKTDQPYHQDTLPGRKFVYDWAAMAGNQLDSTIELVAAYHRLSNQLRQLQNLLNLAYQLENFHRRSSTTTTPNEGDENRIGSFTERGPQSISLARLDAELAQCADQVDALLDDTSASTTTTLDELQSRLSALHERIVQRFARAAGHRPLSNGPSETRTSLQEGRTGLQESRTGLQARPSESSAGLQARPSNNHLLLNPTSSPQRLICTSDTGSAPTAGATWLYATGCDSQQRLSMIDLPAFGMLPIALQPAAPPARKREPTLVQGEGLLVNDFMELQIDPTTGALRSLHMPGKRGNRLSLQIARRDRKGTTIDYSQMQVSELRTVENSPVHGLVRATGFLLQGGQRTGSFEIDYELFRGQRVLHIGVNLSSLTPLTGSPWASAYVVRTAWPSEAGILTTRSCSSRQAFPSGKAIATEWIEIDDVEHKTYLLPAGLPFHQRVEGRFLETLLGQGTAGEFKRKFGIGIDLPNPSVAALQFGLDSISVALEETTAVKSEPAWLTHIDAKNVVMQLDAPLVDSQGNCAGLRVHLSELTGKSVTARIRTLREVREAHRVDYQGNRIAKLTVEGDTTSIAIRPHEMTFIDLEWA